MNVANMADREKLSLAVKQLMKASREPVAHTRRTIDVQLSHLDSLRLFQRANTQATQDYVNRTAIVFRRNILGKSENERLLEQLNRAHGESMEPEERRFLDHSLDYHRRRLLEGKW